ncbi:MAG: FG-GAP-like repeat-containing protein [Planctomycetota bacterium]|nr:FG-GAP-like repeat-containing protein [Planctomycetota bacterium]
MQHHIYTFLVSTVAAAAVSAQTAPTPETLGDGCGATAPTFPTQPVISYYAVGASSVCAADVDGDADIDVISASASDDTIAWYENTDGLGAFSSAHPTHVISTSADDVYSIHVADVDGDGDFDVLSASRFDDKIAWYENTDGFGTFGPQLIISTSADGAHSVYAADIDGDGDIDVLSASVVDDKIAWYENTDGLGTFGAEQVISTSAIGAISVYAADVDGDGDIDVLSASYTDDKIAWYENTDGLGSFGPQLIISTNANGAWNVYAADVDGDGDVDVLSASALDDKIAWYENTDGLGFFGAQQVISTNADSARSVYAADVDGDGDLDVLSASRNDDKIAWYENDSVGSLTLSSNPLQLGGYWALQADNVEGSLALFFFGDTALNTPLDLLGGPGCTSYTNANLGAFVEPATFGTSDIWLAVPNNPALVGFEVTAQSTCASSNALGFSTSNGLRATAGY